MSLHKLKVRMTEHDGTPTFPHHVHTMKQQTKMGHGQQQAVHKKRWWLLHTRKH